MDSATNRSSTISLYIICLLFTCFTFFQQTLPISASDHFQLALGITSQNFVYFSSLFFISYAMMQLPGGLLLDRFGFHYVLPLGLAFTTLGIIIFWISAHHWTIGLGRILTGFGCSIAYITAIYVSSRFFEKNRLPFLICLIECSATIGGLIATQPLQWAIKGFGWGIVGFLNVGFCGLLLIWSCVSIKALGEIKQIQVENNKAPLLRGVTHVLKNKTTLTIFGYSFCTWFVMMSFPGYWFKDYLKAVHQYSTGTSLTLVEIYWGSFLIACLGVGLFTRYFNRSKGVLILLSSIAFLTYLAMAQPYLFSYRGLALFSIFGGISASGIIIAFSLIPSIIEPRYHGTAVAMNNTFVVLGGYAGQTLFGLIVTHLNISQYFNLLEGSNIEPHHYTALLIYLLFTLLGFLFALLIQREPM